MRRYKQIVGVDPFPLVPKATPRRTLLTQTSGSALAIMSAFAPAAARAEDVTTVTNPSMASALRPLALAQVDLGDELASSPAPAPARATPAGPIARPPEPAAAWTAPQAEAKSASPVEAAPPRYVSSDAVQAVPSAGDADDEYRIRVRADTLVLTPVISTGLIGSSHVAVAGQAAEFLGYTNYPAFVQRGEIRVFAAGQSSDAEPLAAVPVNGDGFASWTPPSDAPVELFYVFRVYGADGQFDETRPHELTIVATSVPLEPAERPEFGRVDEADRRGIALSGTMTTVSGRADPASEEVRLNGQLVPVDANGAWAAQQIMPREGAGAAVSIERGGTQVAQVSQSLARPERNWLVVGQGDLTIGHRMTSGAGSLLADDLGREGTYTLGRAAFYARGALDNDIRVVAALDTGEAPVEDLLSNLDRKDPQQLLRRLNSADYYPTYGDGSVLSEDAPTQGRFYLRVRRHDSQFVVGNFTTALNGAELAQLDRGLFGALLDVNSDARTSFGERRLQVTAFASDPGTVPAREEFRGTGGSLYFLQRQDVTVGSERIRIETRDRDTGIVLESRDLRANEDYDFDPLQGRLLLLRPLPSYVRTDSAVREGNGAGNVPVIVARYEYTPAVGDVDGYTVGGRAAGWLGDVVRLGVTAQRETSAEAAQTLLGADAIVRLTPGTYVKAEIAQSEGPGFAEARSVDGGLSFTDIPNPGTGDPAHAWRVEFAANLAEIQRRQGDRGTVSGFYEDHERGFASGGRLTPERLERWGLGGAMPLFNGLVSARVERLRTPSTGTATTGTFDLSQRVGEFEGKISLRHEEREGGSTARPGGEGARTDGAMELGWRPEGGPYSAYAFGQLSLERDATRQRNNRAGVGARARLTDRLSITGEVSEGDGGLGADVQLNHRLGEGSEAYVGYALRTDRDDTGTDSQNIFPREGGALTVGARHRFSDALSVYGENRVGLGGEAPSLARTFGLRFAPAPALSVSGSVENSEIEDPVSGPFRRLAGSLSVGYATDAIRVGSAVEARRERGRSGEQTVWLLRNDISLKLNPDWRFIGRLNLARAEGDSASIPNAEFTEGVAGLAFRPVANNRFNALFRATYFEDLGPRGQRTGSGRDESPRQVSTVFSADASYDITPQLQLSGKYAYRGGRVSLGRDSDDFVSSDAHLGVLRLDYRLTRRWDAMVEGRALWVTASDDMRTGALVGVYRHITDNVRIGGGYSFSRFSDDLTDQSYRSHGPFINLVGAF